MSDRDPKQVILDAALQVFAAFGYEGATTGQIIARAGISNGALFHHFPSKDAIGEALYLQGIASYQEGLVKALERHRGPKAARATLKAAVHHHLAWVEANRDLAWFMYERGRPDWQPAHGAGVRQLNRATAIHVRDWMVPLVQAGVIRDLPLTALAAVINGPAHFVARRWLSGLTSVSPTSFTDLLAEAAWAAIAPHKTRPSPAQPPRVYCAALVEAAALDVVRSAPANATGGEWSLVHLAMNGVLDAPALDAESTIVRSIRKEGNGRIAMIDVDLIDAQGRATANGNVVCVWRED
jgi:AcrR family transcriptional regulator